MRLIKDRQAAETLAEVRQLFPVDETIESEIERLIGRGFVFVAGRDPWFIHRPKWARFEVVTVADLGREGKRVPRTLWALRDADGEAPRGYPYSAAEIKGRGRI